MSLRKEVRGMGFRHLHSSNLAISKHVWNFLSNPNTLAARVSKSKYFLDVNVMDSMLGHNPSFVWGSIGRI